MPGTVNAPCKRGCPACNPHCSFYVLFALLDLGCRRSRHPMTEQGAAADNACRNGAPRGARAPRKGPRAPGPPLPSEDLVPEAWRVAGLAHPAEEVSQTSWAPPGAPFPSYWKGKENRETGAAGRPKNKTPAQRSVG